MFICIYIGCFGFSRVSRRKEAECCLFTRLDSDSQDARGDLRDVDDNDDAMWVN